MSKHRGISRRSAKRHKGAYLRGLQAREKQRQTDIAKSIAHHPAKGRA